MNQDENGLQWYPFRITNERARFYQELIFNSHLGWEYWQGKGRRIVSLENALHTLMRDGRLEGEISLSSFQHTTPVCSFVYSPNRVTCMCGLDKSYERMRETVVYIASGESDHS